MSFFVFGLAPSLTFSLWNVFLHTLPPATGNPIRLRPKFDYLLVASMQAQYPCYHHVFSPPLMCLTHHPLNDNAFGLSQQSKPVDILAERWYNHVVCSTNKK